MRKSRLKKTALVFTLFIIAVLTNSLYAQNNSKKAFFGVGLGINDNGFGFITEVPIASHFSLLGNIGLGGWGYKYGLGINYYLNQEPYGSSFSLGYSIATGLDNFETNLTVEPDGESEKVKLDLNNVGTINLMFGHSWKIGRTAKFGLKVGYALSLTNTPYEMKTDDIELDDVSEQVLQIMEPGGLIIGLGFMF